MCNSRSPVSPPQQGEVSRTGADALKQEIREFAASIGLPVFGVVHADTPLTGAGRLLQWLADGAHGTMSWMERNNDLRLDPQKLFAGARSILFFGADSRTIVDPRDAENGFPEKADYYVARYARGRDYHKIFAGCLKKLSAFLAGKGGEQRACVDTAPVMEKLLAALAGLGWQGRSTLLINPQHGPWLLLGAIFTTLEIPADAPMRPHCKVCYRCVKNCPTGAINERGFLDARRCVAYLTIEHNGAIPLELRPRIGKRVFGCDICLETCPWGRGRQSLSPAFPAPDTEITERFPVLLQDSLEWDEQEFARRFNGTPLKRLGLHRWLRNACVVLGNVGIGADLPALKKFLQHADPLLAEHARWAVNQIELRDLGLGLI